MLRVGIDVGGTFTDFLVVSDSRDRAVYKTNSIPSDPGRAVVSGLAEIAAARGTSLPGFLAEVETIVHGTTVTTNALLERQGALTGLLVTEGFRDVLPLRDGTREEPYDNRLEAPVPLVPRYLRLPVSERVDTSGREVQALDGAQVRAAGRRLADAGVVAVAVSFLHSWASAGHEREALATLAEELPEAYLCSAADLLPRVGYYRRTSTAVLTAYIGPIISSYLESLTSSLRDAGFTGVLLLMQSNGGVATPEEMKRQAALSLLSGPAAAPVAGLAHVTGHFWDRCLTIDMGGTSFDVAVAKDSAPLAATDGVIERWQLGLPMVDVTTIGTGGGSVAYVDAGGLLRVGPRSTGAVPGPACYGRGGTLATVTDADVVLGYLSPEGFRSGGLSIDPEAARAALARDVAGPLGIDVVDAAAGVYDVVNTNMAAGIRELTARRGLDPREFPLVVAGGAGPLHAAAIASEFAIRSLIVPRESSVFCAAGLLACDFKHDYEQSCATSLDRLDPGRLRSAWADMAERGLATLRREGIEASAAVFRPSLDLRYAGQWHELTVPLPAEVMRSCDPAVVMAEFHKLHDALFGYSLPVGVVEVLNARLSVVGLTNRTARRASPQRRGRGQVRGRYRGRGRHVKPTAVRPIWSPASRQMVEAPVYAGRSLTVGDAITGPAIIDLETTSVVVLDQFDVLIDETDSIVLTSREPSADVSPAPPVPLTP